MDIHKSKSFTIPIIIGLLILVNIIGPISFFIHHQTYERTIGNIHTGTANPADPTPTTANMQLLFAGTTFWGRNTNKMARASELGVKYPFSQLDTLDRNSFDAWIAGLECPVTDKGHTDYNENTLLLFNCDPDYLPEAAQWFTAFSLGNNHTDNMGVDGFATTKTYLTEAGIQYFGHYDYRNTTEICAPIILPLRVTYSNSSERTHSIPVGLCGIHGVFGVPTEAALQVIKTYSAIMPTIVIPHMGAEYKAEADTLRQNIYRKLIDYGAAMVIGDHPHWIQNTEAYKGKLIVYSMGNFMFDQLWSAETSRSAAITAAATFDPALDYTTWDTVSAACLADRSTCLNVITAANLPLINPSWSFDYRGTVSTVTRIPRLADPTEQAAIGSRLNWANTLSGLK